MNTIKVLGISGSLRKDSHNTAALRAAAELAPDGMEIEIFDLGDIPGFRPELEEAPPKPVADLKEKVRASEAILIATPEYNYSIPGVLKNALDWGSRPYAQGVWEGKPAAIMGVSGGGISTARAQYDLRKVMVALNMFPLNRPEVMIGNSGEKFDAEGRLTHAPTREFIRSLLENLKAWTLKLA